MAENIPNQAEREIAPTCKHVLAPNLIHPEVLPNHRALALQNLFNNPGTTATRTATAGGKRKKKESKETSPDQTVNNLALGTDSESGQTVRSNKTDSSSVVTSPLGLRHKVAPATAPAAPPFVQRCAQLIETVRALDDNVGTYFNCPVDEEECFDYREVVSHPTCLNSIMEKLEQGRFATADDFRAEFNLLISNCKAYCTGKYPYILSIATSMEVEFNKGWKELFDEVEVEGDEKKKECWVAPRHMRTRQSKRKRIMRCVTPDIIPESESDPEEEEEEEEEEFDYRPAAKRVTRRESAPVPEDVEDTWVVPAAGYREPSQREKTELCRALEKVEDIEKKLEIERILLKNKENVIYNEEEETVIFCPWSISHDSFYRIVALLCINPARAIPPSHLGFVMHDDDDEDGYDPIDAAELEDDYYNNDGNDEEEDY